MNCRPNIRRAANAPATEQAEVRPSKAARRKARREGARLRLWRGFMCELGRGSDASEKATNIRRLRFYPRA